MGEPTMPAMAPPRLPELRLMRHQLEQTIQECRAELAHVNLLIAELELDEQLAKTVQACERAERLHRLPNAGADGRPATPETIARTPSPSPDNDVQAAGSRAAFESQPRSDPAEQAPARVSVLTAGDGGRGTVAQLGPADAPPGTAGLGLVHAQNEQATSDVASQATPGMGQQPTDHIPTVILSRYSHPGEYTLSDEERSLVVEALSQLTLRYAGIHDERARQALALNERLVGMPSTNNPSPEEP